jgi:hypothetical protein
MALGARSGRRTVATCAYVVIGASALAWAHIANADPNLQTVGTTSLGYTDNVESSPNTPIPGVTPKSGSPFAILSPGLVLALSTPRSIHRLGYAFAYVVFFEGPPTQNSTANRLDYQGFVDVSRSAGLLLDANVTQSRTDAATGLGQDTSVLPGPTSYVGATGDETLSIDLPSQWRTWEGTSFLLQTPLSSGPNPQTTSMSGRVGLEHAWRSEALGVEGRLNDTIINNSVLLTGAPAGTQDELTSTSVLQWRQDLGRHFSDRLEAGTMRIDRLNTHTGFWSPAAAAALTYTNDQGALELSYAHAMTSNLLLGQYLLVDEVLLHGGLPIIRRPDVLLAVTAGYQAGQLLNEDTTLAAHVNTFLVDVGVACQVADPMLLSLRYQYVQRWSDVTLPPLPLSFTRNTVLLSATIKWPPDRQMPRRYRAPNRVDRSDEIRDTDAPGDAPGAP